MNWHKLRVGQLDAPTVRLIRKASPKPLAVNDHARKCLLSGVSSKAVPKGFIFYIQDLPAFAFITLNNKNKEKGEQQPTFTAVLFFYQFVVAFKKYIFLLLLTEFFHKSKT